MCDAMVGWRVWCHQLSRAKRIKERELLRVNYNNI